MSSFYYFSFCIKHNELVIEHNLAISSAANPLQDYFSQHLSNPSPHQRLINLATSQKQQQHFAFSTDQALANKFVDLARSRVSILAPPPSTKGLFSSGFIVNVLRESTNHFSNNIVAAAAVGVVRTRNFDLS